MSETGDASNRERSSFSSKRAVAVHIENPDLPLDRASVSYHRSLAESVQPVEANCAYTVAHTLPGLRVIRFDRHLKRLFESARRLGYTPDFSEDSVRHIIGNTLERHGGERCKFRITLLREGGLVIALEPYAGLPPEIRSRGIDCALAPHSSRGDPDTKTTSWMTARGTLSSRDVYEVLLCDRNGYVLEGSSSNVFFVTGDSRSPVLRTAEEGILKGITRSIILELVEPETPVERSALHETDLATVREGFICSSTRGVVPIRRIDDRSYTAPGALTSRISTLYNEWVEENAQPLLP